MSGFTSTTSIVNCNTCKAQFASLENLKDHYKGDWHVVNSKRRANGLSPVLLEDFVRLQLVAKKSSSVAANRISKTSAPFHVIGVSTAAKPDNLMGRVQANQIKSITPLNTVVETSPLITDPTPGEDIFDGNYNIFDENLISNCDEAVEYMLKTYGLFIPDKEYVSDLPGLLKYLNDKVKKGHICLYCNKQFQDHYSCLNHMRSKSHYKLAYQEDIDIAEFEDFYDFSAAYSDDEDDASYETVEEDSDENEEEPTAATQNISNIRISPIGELILGDGRTVGHRDFRIYYKQKFRPEDTRPAVLAQKREELVRICSRFGDSAASGSLAPEEIMKLSDMEVIDLMYQKQRALRKNQILEQRAKAKHEYRNQRKEYQSTVDKLRSSATTTAKIRDWHRKL